VAGGGGPFARCPVVVDNDRKLRERKGRPTGLTARGGQRWAVVQLVGLRELALMITSMDIGNAISADDGRTNDDPDVSATGKTVKRARILGSLAKTRCTRMIWMKPVRILAVNQQFTSGLSGSCEQEPPGAVANMSTGASSA